MEKKNLKFLRRAHWNTCQELKARLAELPPSYSLRVDLSGVNFSRLRPYFYLLVHQVHWYCSFFFCQLARISLPINTESPAKTLCETKILKVFTVIFCAPFNVVFPTMARLALYKMRTCVSDHYPLRKYLVRGTESYMFINYEEAMVVWCSVKKPGNFAKKRRLCTEKLINDHGSLKQVQLKLGCLVFSRDRL